MSATSGLAVAGVEDDLYVRMESTIEAARNEMITGGPPFAIFSAFSLTTLVVWE